MKTFLLEMITPEKTFFSGQAVSINVMARDGLMELLADHVPVVIGLNPSMITIVLPNERRICANGEGFVVVDKEKTVVLCQTMEWPDEIDSSRVERAISEHTEKIKNAKSMADYRLSKMTLARAFARLKVKNIHGDKNRKEN